jgi:hypothetical protein
MMPSKAWNIGLPNCGLAVTVNLWLDTHNKTNKENLPATENRERAQKNAMVAVTNVEQKETIVINETAVVECGELRRRK